MSILKTYKSSIILIAAMLVGGIVGFAWGEGAAMLQPVADIFLNLLYCCVVPLIFVSLSSSIAKMENLKKLRKVLTVILVGTVITGVVASLFMVGFSAILDPAKGTTITFAEEVGEFSGNSNFLAMFTVNDFPALFSRSNLMALMVFTILFAIAIIAAGEKGKPVVNLLDAGTEIIIKLINIVMKLAPLGLGCYFAILIGENGQEMVGPLGRAILVYMVVIVLYYILSNTLFAYIGAGAAGVKAWWKSAIPPTLTALGTCSSAASIPVNMIAAKEIGIPDDIADITIPMGANLHKDGACVIQILKIAFMCSVFGINFFTPTNILTAVVVAVIASTVMGGIPAGGYVGEIFIVSAFGFPAASIPIMVLIGTITDAPATAVNVTGDTGLAMIVARFVEGKDWFKKAQAEKKAKAEAKAEAVQPAKVQEA